MHSIHQTGVTAREVGRHVGPPTDPLGIGELRGTGGRHVGPADRDVATDPDLRFADALASAAGDRDLHLSGHALRRLEQRGIDLGPNELDRLRGAFDQLAGKGGRQSVVMLDQVAYVVNVPSKTVVTAVAPNDERDAVFTKIDSVVIA
jgi:flagellar operon protein